jgi:hypothetical protein
MHRRVGVVALSLALALALPLAAQQHDLDPRTALSGVHPSEIQSVKVDPTAAMKAFLNNSNIVKTPAPPKPTVSFAPFKPHTISYLLPKISVPLLPFKSAPPKQPATSARGRKRQTAPSGG